jgi:hypothetical protein
MVLQLSAQDIGQLPYFEVRRGFAGQDPVVLLRPDLAAGTVGAAQPRQPPRPRRGPETPKRAP